MRCAFVPPLTSIFPRAAFHAPSASMRVFSKSQPGISASRFFRAPSMSTAETPTFTRIASFAAVLKLANALTFFPDASTAPIRTVSSTATPAEPNGFENFAAKYTY